MGKGYLIGEAALYGEAYPFGGLIGGVEEPLHGRGGFKLFFFFSVAKVPTGWWV